MARFRHKRENFIPEGAVLFPIEDLKAEVYTYEKDDGTPCAIGFKGRAQKPTFHFRYDDADARARSIAIWANTVLADQKRKEKELKERNAPHTLKVGDIMVASWGYDQTNIDFYQVVGLVSKNFVRIACVASKLDPKRSCDGLSMQAYVLPDLSRVSDGSRKCRVNMSGGNPTISLSSFHSAHLWDGKSQHQTSYA